MNAEHCKAYTLLQEQQIDDIHAHGYLLRHNKSGAACCFSRRRMTTKYSTSRSVPRRPTAPA